VRLLVLRAFLKTLIYSKTDAIVEWHYCIESGPNIEAIEVSSSHLGLPYSPEVLAIITARVTRGSEQKPLGPVSSDTGRRNLPRNRRRDKTPTVGSYRAAA